DNVLDKFDHLPMVSALERLAKAKSAFGRFSESGSTIWSNHPARPWSVGEALVTTAWFSRHGVYRTVWRNLGWKLLNLTGLRLKSRMPFEWKSQFRHAMHVAHGLAVTIEAERVKHGDTLGEIRLVDLPDQPALAPGNGWSGFGMRDPVVLVRPDGTPALE